MKHLAFMFCVLLTLSGCTSLRTTPAAVCIPVAVETPPAKLKLRTFNGSQQRMYVMDDKGALFYGEASATASVKPLFVKQHAPQDYLNTLNLAWKVWRDYRYTNAGSADPTQTVYELSFGETWNAFLIRIPAAADNTVPANLQPLVQQLACLQAGNCIK